jgi:hypothetical protein
MGKSAPRTSFRDLVRASILANALAAVLAAGAFAQAAPIPLALLGGVVRDSAGQPIAGAQISLRAGTASTRTDSAGAFTLSDIEPGARRVLFRRLGYASVEYNWAARSGERTEVTVSLRAIPKTLDPVVVQAQEDARFRTASSMLGLVVDTAGAVIPEAEVQLVGANMGGVTRANGGFLFKPLASGSYVVRVRKLGYAPATLTLQLVQNDDREVVIRMRPLATDLEPVVVTEKSGYGRDQLAWDELERRKRWVDFHSRMLGPEDLKGFYGLSLDYATGRMGLYRPTPPPNRAQHINPSGTSRRLPAGSLGTDTGDACILLNGRDPVERPLRVYSTNDVELLEVYPSGTDITGTVGAHFSSSRCRPTSLLETPTYYVLWLKGDKS